MGVRIRHETLLRERGPIQVAERDAVAADIDLAADADRADIAMLVEHPDRGVRDRMTDQHPPLRMLHAPEGRVAGLARSVAIPDGTGPLQHLDREIRR